LVLLPERHRSQTSSVLLSALGSPKCTEPLLQARSGHLARQAEVESVVVLHELEHQLVIVGPVRLREVNVLQPSQVERVPNGVGG
jgi:hypothetical protein